jgi:ribonuclease BN (tRNA processing enzyme)
MKLTILGSGTLVPSASRNSAGYFVELADANIILDCGAGTLHALARYDLPWERTTHLFLSHFHVDHAGGLASLMFAFRNGMKTKRDSGFTIVGPDGVDRLIDGLKLAYGASLFTTKFPTTARVIAPGEKLQIGPNSTLWVAKTPHTQQSLAVRIESGGRSLCYTGDTAYDESLASFFRGADILISECSFREPRATVAHLSIAEVSRLASQANVARLIVTHFYFEVDEAALKDELQGGYDGEVIIGRDGLSIEVD